MWHDPIVDDIHKVREAYAAKFNNNIAAMVRDLQEKAKERQLGGKLVIAMPPSDTFIV
jgi:hypothetical protein